MIGCIGLFCDEKYPGERHVNKYSYLGPETRTDVQLAENFKPKQGEQPINKIDQIAAKYKENTKGTDTNKKHRKSA